MSVKIIAEIGINHNGDVEIAKELALVAKEAGCDFVKLQKRNIETCYPKKWLQRPCDSPWGTTVEDKVRGRELSWEEITDFDKYCKNIGIRWTASCFDLQSFAELNKRFVGLPFYKVPSGLAESKKYLSAIAERKQLTLVSLGLLETPTLIERIFSLADCPYVLNHCVALYPPTPNDFNLKYLVTLQKELNNPYCRGIGYSSHENGITSTLLAIALGATWIEQHVTLQKDAYGADQVFSLTPHACKNWVTEIRKAEAMLGAERRKVLTGREKRPVQLP